MKSDKVMEMVAALDEVMRQYDKCRQLWVEKFNNDSSFNEWFTNQVITTKGA